MPNPVTPETTYNTSVLEDELILKMVNEALVQHRAERKGTYPHSETVIMNIVGGLLAERPKSENTIKGLTRGMLMDSVGDMLKAHERAVINHQTAKTDSERQQAKSQDIMVHRDLRELVGNLFDREHFARNEPEYCVIDANTFTPTDIANLMLKCDARSALNILTYGQMQELAVEFGEMVERKIGKGELHGKSHDDEDRDRVAVWLKPAK